MNLLIVDDNKHIRKIIRNLLLHHFDNIYEAVNGIEAITMCSGHKPDWVTMDIGMPEVDGLTAAQLLKKEFPDSRIIIVSQFHDEIAVNISRYIGVEKYFFKDDLSLLSDFFDSLEDSESRDRF